MELAFILFWAVAVLYGLIALAAIATLLLVAPRRRVNLSLCLLLFADLAFVITHNLALVPTENDALSRLYQGLHNASLGALPFVQLLFLTYALDTPITAPLRRPPVRAALLAVAVATPIWLSLPYAGALPQDWAELFGSVLFLCALVSLFGILAAVLKLQSARTGTPARQEARAFLLALGTRDTVWFGLVVFVQMAALYPALQEPANWVYAFGFGVAGVLFGVFLLIGILRYQLLGIEVRMKLTLRRGTLGGLFLGAFILTTTLVEKYLETRPELGWVAGGLVCGAMLLVLHPLQRFAERVASVAVPNAKAPEQLSRQERLDLFEHQLRIAWEDGSLNPKERRLLEVTRTRLGISAEDANRLELALPNLLSPSTRRGKQRPMGAPR